METKELNNYKIEFYSEEEWEDLEYENHRFTIYKYAGLVLDINENLAEKIVDCIGGKLCNNVKQYNEFKDYNHNYDKDYKSLKTAKESFQTLSNLKYCVINKIE